LSPCLLTLLTALTHYSEYFLRGSTMGCLMVLLTDFSLPEQ
jgi:hypothetical protein